MAFIQINLMSESLMRTINVNAIIPVDKISFNTKEVKKQKKFKTLYLLHGVYGSQVDWINGTNIQRWAEEKNLAVIMPAGENRFYIDQPKTHDYYGKLIGEELVRVTRKLFPLSDKKEDTFICGLSMGGFGALRNGLKHYDTFGYVAGLSSANILDIENVKSSLLGEDYMETVFGDLKKARNSDKSISWLIRNNAREGKTDQKIYMACGESDMLKDQTRELSKLFRENGYEITYETGPGAHEWDFWNRYIKHVVDWLPLDDDKSGINSGNVSGTSGEK